MLKESQKSWNPSQSLNANSVWPASSENHRQMQSEVRSNVWLKDTLQSLPHAQRCRKNYNALLGEWLCQFQGSHHHMSGLFLAEEINKLYVPRCNLSQFSKAARNLHEYTCFFPCFYKLWEASDSWFKVLVLPLNSLAVRHSPKHRSAVGKE